MSNINDILIYELNKGEQVAFSGKLPTGGQPSQSTTNKILSNPNARSLYGKDVDRHMDKHKLATHALKLTNAGKVVGGFLGAPGGSTVGAAMAGGPVAAAATMGYGAATYGGAKLADRAIKHHLVNSLTKSDSFKNLKHNEIGANSSLQNQHQLTKSFHNIFNKRADDRSSIVNLTKSGLKFAKSHIAPELPQGPQSQQTQLKGRLLQKYRPTEPDTETKIVNKTGNVIKSVGKIASGIASSIKSKFPNLQQTPANIYQK